MESWLGRVEITSVLSAISHPMQPGFYPVKSSPRYSDCFVYVRHGAALYDFGSYTLRVREGDILYLAYQSLYSIQADEGYDVAYIDCMIHIAGKQPGEGRSFSMHIGSEIETPLVNLARTWLPGSDSSRFLALSVLYSLFSLMLKKRGDDYISLEKRMRLQEAESIMKARLGDPDLACGELAAAAGMSPAAFRRLFSRCYGVSPVRYLLSLRMKEAMERLSDGEESIERIAERTGFSSGAYFSRVFSQTTGISPREFRKEVRVSRTTVKAGKK